MASKLLSSSLSGSKKSPSQDSSGEGSSLPPILIIPGFMSSGLEIIESKLKPGWKGERIWLNLASVGISAMYFGKAQKRTDFDSSDVDEDDSDDGEGDAATEERRQWSYKSAWLKHMVLASDNESDPPGVKVRALSGLSGVDYLTPGAFTSHLSYVFGPVIEFLKEKGYNRDGGKVNLMASPYDWRMAPSSLEKRDKYFSRTIGYIEELYNKNDSSPVVLLCHSLGCKTAHYLLNFALDKKGQGWIDKHIHTYMPIGGPHLGAPKTMRGLISGLKMSLDTFLSDEEALHLSRSIGSGFWMLPSDLPRGVPASNYILPHGVLELSIVHAVDVDPLVNKRTGTSRPKKYQLIVNAKGLDGPNSQESERSVKTPFHKISPDHGPNVVVFTDTISFATETNHSNNESLQFLLQEPGLASAKKEKEKCRCNPLVWCLCCLCIPCMLAYKLLEFVLCGLIRGATITADAIAGSAGGSTTLAFSEGIKIPKSVWKGKSVTIKVPIYHTDDYGQYEGCFRGRKKARKVDLYIKLQWKNFNPTRSFRKLCSPVCRPSDDAVILPITRNGKSYEEFSGYDIAEREGLEKHLRFNKQFFDDDPYGPRDLSALEAPPVQKIHAIYGVNIDTEVGCVYSRQDMSSCLSEQLGKGYYVPDKKAVIASGTGYKVSGGLIMETSKTKQECNDTEISGDGTVPYWSLSHVKTWNSEACNVTVQEIDKAEHRKILNDPRFHDALYDYLASAAQ